MLGRLFVCLVAAIIASACVVATSIGPAAQTLIVGAGASGCRDDVMTSRDWLSPAEAGGGVGTKHHPGLIYASSEGEKPDPGPAVKGYRKATVLGRGVLDGYAEAAYWFWRADEQGDALAHFNVGLMYYRGQGVSENYAEAVRWFRKAAEQGNPPAQTYLGLMYVLGWGVRKDEMEAYKWWILAATRGDQQARKNLDNITGTMTPAQLAEAHKLAREWLRVFEKRKDK